MLLSASFYIDRKRSRQYWLDNAESLVYTFLKPGEQVDIIEGKPVLTKTKVWLS